MNTETLMREVKGNLFVGSSRVSLQTVITARKRGETPEQIRDNFPSLTLAEVYGAILYYLEHQAALDTAFAEQERALDEADATNRGEHARFFDTMHSRFEASRSQDKTQASGDDEASEA